VGEEVAADLLAQDVIPAGEALSRQQRLAANAVVRYLLALAVQGAPASTLSQSLAMLTSSHAQRRQYT
jgi:hypothetical protein